uniref:Uncharacterized protein n=1 Tax=Alexandrium monilatum TaxID=311494 RepID=A0A7S4QAU4_9DINO
MAYVYGDVEGRYIRPIYTPRQGGRGRDLTPRQSPRSLDNPLNTAYRSTARARPRDSALFKEASGPGVSVLEARPSSAFPAGRYRRSLGDQRIRRGEPELEGTTRFWVSHGSGFGRYGYSPGPAEQRAQGAKTVPVGTLQTNDTRALRVERLPEGSKPSEFRNYFKAWVEQT